MHEWSRFEKLLLWVGAICVPVGFYIEAIVKLNFPAPSLLKDVLRIRAKSGPSLSVTKPDFFRIDTVGDWVFLALIAIGLGALAFLFKNARSHDSDEL